jgi:hypothetical protein
MAEYLQEKTYSFCKAKDSKSICQKEEAQIA